MSLISVKFKEGLEFSWPEKIIKGVSSIQEGHDQLMTQQEYDDLIALNTVAFGEYKAERDSLANQVVGVEKFQALRDYWRDKMDSLAFENNEAGITEAGKSKEVADSFKDVHYYLSVNTPSEAIAAMSSIVPIPTFLTQEKIDSLVGEFSAKVNELWPQQ